MGIYKDIWKKEKDGNRKEQRSFIRVAIISSALVLLFLLLKKDNVIRWVQAGFTISAQNREIRANQARIDEMEEKIRSLKSDRDSLEKFARENFHFAEKGDDIYLIP